jgi:hypothetical protein
MKEGSLPSTHPTLSCVPGWMIWTRLYPSAFKHEVIALNNEIHALNLLGTSGLHHCTRQRPLTTVLKKKGFSKRGIEAICNAHLNLKKL